MAEMRGQRASHRRYLRKLTLYLSGVGFLGGVATLALVRLFPLPILAQIFTMLGQGAVALSLGQRLGRRAFEAANFLPLKISSSARRRLIRNTQFVSFLVQISVTMTTLTLGNSLAGTLERFSLLFAAITAPLAFLATAALRHNVRGKLDHLHSDNVIAEASKVRTALFHGFTVQIGEQANIRKREYTNAFRQLSTVKGSISTTEAKIAKVSEPIGGVGDPRPELVAKAVIEQQGALYAALQIYEDRHLALSRIVEQIDNSDLDNPARKALLDSCNELRKSYAVFDFYLDAVEDSHMDFCTQHPYPADAETAEWGQIRDMASSLPPPAEALDSRPLPLPLTRLMSASDQKAQGPIKN